MTNSLNEVKTSLKPDEISLLPCPFCGGKPTVKKPRPDAYQIVCDFNGCLVAPSTLFYYELGRAVEIWNTRAERTCHIVSEEYDDLLEYTSVEFSCGHYAIGLPSYFDYCPKCGAKVVEE